MVLTKKINRIGNINARYRSIMLYGSLVFLPLLVLALVFYVQLRDIMVEKDTANVQNFVYEAQTAMDNQLLVYDNLTNYVVYNQTISQVLSYDYKSAYDKYNQVVSVLDPMLASLRYFHDDLKQVTIYMEGEEIFHDTTLAPLNSIENEKWYKEACAENVTKWFVDKEKRQAFSARRMPTLDEYGLTGILYINVDYENLFAPFETTTRSNYGIYIVDGDGTVIYETDTFEERYASYVLDYTEFVKQKHLAEEGKAEYAIVEAVSARNGWRIGLYMPEKFILSTISPLIIVAVVIVITCIVLIAVVQSLIYQIYNARFKQKAYEMKALQAQINPHFLYNSLSLINWKAIEAQKDDISQITLALSKFYRTSLNKGKNTLRIAEEIENVKAYLHIQQVMHDDSFDVIYDISPEILEYETLNLILQPVVENAIGHGIELLEDRRGVLTIIGRKREEAIDLIVKDNGVGMDEEKAKSILTEHSKGYGVRNVNERLRLYYGVDGIMKVNSKPGEGTEIVITLPI